MTCIQSSCRRLSSIGVGVVWIVGGDGRQTCFVASHVLTTSVFGEIYGGSDCMRIGRTPWEWRALVWVEMVGLLRLWRLRHGGKVCKRIGRREAVNIR